MDAIAYQAHQTITICIVHTKMISNDPETTWDPESMQKFLLLAICMLNPETSRGAESLQVAVASNGGSRCWRLALTSGGETGPSPGLCRWPDLSD